VGDEITIEITPWTNEYHIPDWVHKLLEIHDLPIELRNDLLAAKKEVYENGAVKYPTKARIKYWLHIYNEYLTNLANTLE